MLYRLGKRLARSKCPRKRPQGIRHLGGKRVSILARLRPQRGTHKCANSRQAHCPAQKRGAHEHTRQASSKRGHAQHRKCPLRRGRNAMRRKQPPQLFSQGRGARQAKDSATHPPMTQQLGHGKKSPGRLRTTLDRGPPKTQASYRVHKQACRKCGAHSGTHR